MNPESVRRLLQQALALCDAGRRADARRLLAGLDGQPVPDGLLAGLAELLRRAGDTEAAVAVGRQAVGRASDAPAAAAAWSNLGLALQQAGEFAEAEKAYGQSLAHLPGYPRALYNLAALQLKLGAADRAEALLGEALAGRPDYPQALHALAIVRRRQGRHGEAGLLLDRLLAAHPGHLAGCRERASLKLMEGLEEEAETELRALCARFPADAGSQRALAQCLEQRKRPGEAARAAERALELDPDNDELLGELENIRRDLCDWRGYPGHIERLLASSRRALAQGRMPPMNIMASGRFPVPADLQRAMAERHAQGLAAGLAVLGRRVQGDPPPLRVGWLSHEFRHNVVGHMLRGLLPAFERKRVAVVGFAYGGDDGSATRRELAAACDEFHDLTGLPDREAAEAIAAAGIHILIDINPYMNDGRPHIAAHRPAPVQVSYLCPMTSGAPWIDWFITDPVATPPESSCHFSEALAWLSPSYLPSPGLQTIAATPSRADLGLPETGRILASFNRQDKILPDVFGLWLALLREYPDTVLWMAVGQDGAKENLRRHAAEAGVDPSRLVFAGYEPDMARHLARLGLADLFLDTFPHTAHVTAIDALWAGVPILTRAGETFASRVAASLLVSLGLPELIAADAGDWLGRARRLLDRPDMLAALRRRLLESRDTAALWQPRIQANRLVRAFEAMWDQYRQGRREAFHIAADTGEQVG